jgi:hypothetical protein
MSVSSTSATSISSQQLLPPKELLESVPLNRRPFPLNAVSHLDNGTLSILQPYTDVSQSDLLLVDAVGLQYRAQLCCTMASSTKNANALVSTSVAASSTSTAAAVAATPAQTQTSAFHGQLVSRMTVIDQHASVVSQNDESKLCCF